jgi:hypothetical protein
MAEETVSLREHLAAIREADGRLDAERDRRYTEVNIEREKALKIKEEADKAALGLAREIQTYKDEKANELREQINSERGRYVTKEELQAAIRELSAKLEPVAGYVTGMQGQARGFSLTTGGIFSLIVGAAAIVAMFVAFGVIGKGGP